MINYFIIKYNNKKNYFILSIKNKFKNIPFKIRIFNFIDFFSNAKKKISR